MLSLHRSSSVPIFKLPSSSIVPLPSQSSSFHRHPLFLFRRSSTRIRAMASNAVLAINLRH
ncbi:hypothetical protein Ccrd_017344 [Cynara cardunculus var. scolymus]|uniref:Uncharacterized protein n=1 Tax=Cynara cardunculus var. scolymus TaxID=59895 RepID=A0A103Y8A2_CYNCS|nr:hypothetical protein Ccrd_017344 [Cynara cardunculus var. scolymus]